MAKKSIKKILIIFISLLISLFFLYLAFKQVEWPDVVENFKKTNLGFILISLIAFTFSYIFRASRWRLLFQEKNDHPFRSYFDILVASFALNNVIFHAHTFAMCLYS